ncbi:MAG TPA: antitoxin Xre/MbcA/ParS toxin-binding domain-containing protein [Cyclobacteriaceae bacterium]|nr:antitoxin Xre/MbcA/ParS toxin-binding domain-containing protein [Cyclobacteriaceae bacterium]
MQKSGYGKSLKIPVNDMDEKDVVALINASRKGIGYAIFMDLAKISPFSLQEWSIYLHLSERTIQRYKKEKRAFDPMQSERILQIMLLFKSGARVFGSKDKFSRWLESENLALGKITPKELLDNTFGIGLLNDELIRIEHGVLA